NQGSRMKRPVLSKSGLMAAGLAAAVVIWMLTGLVGTGAPSAGPREAVAADAASVPARAESAPPGAAADGRAAAPAPPAVAVTVAVSKATRVAREVVVSGRTEPSRTVEIKAETEGRIVELGADRGSLVAAGERIARIDERDRRAAIAEAEKLVEHRRVAYE